MRNTEKKRIKTARGWVDCVFGIIYARVGGRVCVRVSVSQAKC